MQPTAQASPVNDPPASPTRPVSPEIATPVNPENENPQEAPAPTMRTLATNPRSSSEDVPRPPNNTRLIDMDPDQYVYFQEANETLRFIPERVLKPVRGVYVQLMRSIVNNPQDLLRWKKFFCSFQWFFFVCQEKKTTPSKLPEIASKKFAEESIHVRISS